MRPLQSVTRRFALKVSAAAMLYGGSYPAFAQQSAPDSPKAKELQAMVDKAASLVDSKGKAAFTELGKPDSEWRHGDTYVFVGKMDGVQLFSGAFPNLNGKDLSDMKDTNGKLLIQEFKKTVQSGGSGWVDYMWPKPGQTQPSQKWSYVKAVKVDGEPGYIGAGFYP